MFKSSEIILLIEHGNSLWPHYLFEPRAFGMSELFHPAGDLKLVHTNILLPGKANGESAEH